MSEEAYDLLLNFIVIYTKYVKSILIAENCTKCLLDKEQSLIVGCLQRLTKVNIQMVVIRHKNTAIKCTSALRKKATFKTPSVQLQLRVDTIGSFQVYSFDIGLGG